LLTTASTRYERIPPTSSLSIDRRCRRLTYGSGSQVAARRDFRIHEAYCSHGDLVAAPLAERLRDSRRLRSARSL
jgi:hypothetical protein